MTYVPWSRPDPKGRTGWSSSSESRHNERGFPQREGITLAQQRGVCTGRKTTLTPERAAELVKRAGTGSPKVVLARDYGISRKTVNQYLRHATLER
jgi:DNA invertase Pin-like site-specific DNA recombinase